MKLTTEGTIVSVSDGVIRIHGLADCMQGEMISLPGNRYAIALNLERDSVGAVVMGPYADLAEGMKVLYWPYPGSSGWPWPAGPCG